VNYFKGDDVLKKKINYKMTQLEQIVFNILLDSEDSMTHEKIIQHIPNNKWNSHSVYTAISNLKKKGLVEEAGKVLIARTRAILYKTTLSKPEFYEAMHLHHFETLQDGSIDFVLSALTGFHQERNQEVIEEIEFWLEKQKHLIDKKDQ